MKNNEMRLFIITSILAFIGVLFAYMRLGFSATLLLLIIFWGVIFAGLFNKSEMIHSIERYKIWIVLFAFIISMIVVSMIEPISRNSASSGSPQESIQY